MALTLAFPRTGTKTGHRAEGELAGKRDQEQTFAVMSHRCPRMHSCTSWRGYFQRGRVCGVKQEIKALGEQPNQSEEVSVCVSVSAAQTPSVDTRGGGASGCQRVSHSRVGWSHITAQICG